jgi:sulfur-oxidizing protein SoxX
MRTTTTCVIAMAIVVSVVGCDVGKKSGKGFTLPDGDVARGEAKFVSMGCYHCHSITNVELPALEESDQVIVRLGGKVSRIKTYGELVTSIINPSHRLAVGFEEEDVAEGGESRMRNYNEVMTVSELIDLVAFLQSRYELMEYDPTTYPIYSY